MFVANFNLVHYLAHGIKQLFMVTLLLLLRQKQYYWVKKFVVSGLVNEYDEQDIDG